MTKIFFFVFFLYIIATVFAVGIADGPFELDGDAKSISKMDWDKTYLNTGGDVYHEIKDDVEGATVFSGTVVDTAELSSWHWSSGASDGVPAISNLVNGFTTVYNNVGLLTDVVNFYFGATVTSPGNTVLGIWLIQSSVSLASGGTFLGAHQDGDLFILIALASNQVNNIQVYRWSSVENLVQVYSKAGTQARCASGVEQTACAYANPVDITSYKAGGAVIPKGTFIEGGIKLNDIYPIEMPCFKNYVIETKDSLSTTSNSRDFILGSWPMCGIEVTISCDAVGINAARDGFVYEGVIRVQNPYSRIVNNVDVRIGDTFLQTLPRVLPGETINVAFTGNSKEAPGIVGPANVTGIVGGKYPAVDFSDTARCPAFSAKPALKLTKECEVRMAPYKFADDGTKEIKVFITGSVTNTGNVDLTDVVVADDDGFTWEYPYLGAGQTIVFSRSIKSTDPTIPQYTDTITATGKAVLGLGTAIAQPVTATCPAVTITPGLVLSKTCAVTTVPDGDYETVRVTYTITAKNTGNIELREVNIVDDKGTASLSDDVVYGPITLLPNETTTFTGFYTPANPTAASQSDTVRGSAITIVHLFPSVTATPVTATCTGIKRNPSLVLTKRCESALVPSADGKAVQVTFYGTVTNNGDVTLRNVVVKDDKGTASTADDATFGPFTLTPGETRSFQQSYTPANPTATMFTDTLTASGEPNIHGFSTINAIPVTAQCQGVLVNKKLELTKKCTVATIADVNGYLTFVVNVEGTVKNAGDIDITGVKVFDNDGYSWDIGTLTPNKVVTFTRQYTPSDQTATVFSDTVTATGTAVAGFGPVSASAVTATCSRPDVSPKLNLEKSCLVTLSDPSASGDRTVLIGFEITVTNAGNVPLKDVRVVDDRSTPGDTSDDQSFASFDLLPGEYKRLTGSYAAKNPLATSFTDIATATAKNIYKSFPTVSATPISATCKNVDVKPKLELSKTCVTSLKDTGAGLQVVVGYNIIVSNTGNVALKNIYVTDDSGTPTVTTDDKRFGPLSLTPGSSTTLNGEYLPSSPSAATQSDTVSAYGENTVAGYPIVTAQPYKATCNGVKVNPKLTLEKKCRTTLVDDTDGYQKVVMIVDGSAKNEGDVILTNVKIVDAQDNFVWNLGTLNVGETKTFTQTFNPASVTSSQYTDTIVGSADLPSGLGSTVSNTARAECTGILSNPVLTVTKDCTVVSVDSSVPGKKEIRVTYRGTVTNAGTHTLRNVYVIDDLGTPTVTTDDKRFGPYTLAPGQSQNYDSVYIPADQTKATYSDTVYATGDNNIRGFPGATSPAITATCNSIQNNPALQLTKACVVSLESYQSTERKIIVKYQGEVKNTGNVALVNVLVVDDAGTPTNPADDKTFGPLTLAPGQSSPFSGVYIPANPSLDKYSDTVRATAENLYVGFPGATAVTTAVCDNVKFNPKLTVTKQCLAEIVSVSADSSKVQVTTTGTVKNEGDVELYDVTVYDDDGTTWNFVSLAPGESKPFFKTEYPTNPAAPKFTDTVYATGRLPSGLGTILSSNNATAECVGVNVNPAIELTKQCTVKLDTVAGDLRKVKVYVTGTVKNTGNVKLVNVLVTDDMGTPSTADDVKFGPYTLAPGESKTFSSDYYPADPTAAFYHDTLTATAQNTVAGFANPVATPISAKCQGIISNPVLKLSKECEVDLVVTPGKGKKVQVFYYGEVSNTGDTELRNVYVRDDKGTSDPSDDQIFGPYTLLPGKSQTFSSSYFPDSPTQEYYSDTVSATATSIIIGFPSVTASNVTARCKGVTVNPKLVLTKQCSAVLVPESDGTQSVKVNVIGTASNLGDIELLNVVIKDSDGYQWQFPQINPGESKPLTRTYSPADPTALYHSDTITGSADLPAGLGTVSSTAPATANCSGIKTRPELTLTKQCRTVVENIAADSYLTRVVVYYTGSVRNTGDITLRNVIVRDDKGTPDKPADDATYGPYTLAPNESKNFEGSYYPAQVTAVTQSDTVTASGANLIRGFPGADAVPIKATCQGVSSAPALTLTKTCVTSLETQSDGSKKVLVSYSGTIKNSGDTTLVDVYATDDKGTPLLTTDDQTFGPYVIPPSTSVTFSGSYYPVSSTQANYSDTVRATAKNSIQGFPGATATPVTATCQGIKVNPKLVLYKECKVAAVPRADRFLNVIVVVDGSVSNQGDIELLNVVVRDDIDGFTWTFDKLAVGETKTIHREYAPKNITADFQTDTITGTATLPAGLGPVTASPVSATCKGLKNEPVLTLTKKCVVKAEVFDGVRSQVRVYFDGTVKNNGNFDLLDVVVLDNVGTPSDNSDDKKYGPFDLKVGEERTFSGYYVPTNPTLPNYSDTVTASGTNVVYGFPGTTATAVTATCAGIVTHPSLVLTKTCLVSTEPQGVYQKVYVSYKGTVTNNGDITLVNVVVKETSSGGSATFGPYTLAPAQSASFEGTYYPANPTADVQSDTLTATGDNSIIGFPGTTAVPYTATCKGVKPNPKLTLTKHCDTAFFGTGLGRRVRVSYTGTIKNDGDVAINNVYATDDQGTPAILGDDQTFGPFNLAPGQSQAFDGYYFTDNPTADSFTDVVTAYGDNGIIGFPTVAAAAVSATCEGLVTSPSIAMTKVCSSVVIDDPFENNHQKVQVRIKGTIANTGDIELVDVQVIDSDGYVWNIGYLAIGQVVNFDRNFLPTDPTASYYTDTITAKGNAILGFGPASYTPVTANCTGVSVNPALDVYKECTTKLETVGAYQRVIVNYQGYVKNIGDVKLVNVYVTDDLGTPSNPADDKTYGPFNLAPNESAVFTGSYNPSNPTAATQSDTVRAYGANIIKGFPGASDTATAVCTGIIVNPALALTKMCSTRLADDPVNKDRKRVEVTYTGTVKNTGNVALVNVLVTDNMGTPTNPADDKTFGPYTLAPGQSRDFAGSYVPLAATSPTFSDIVTASGSNIIQGFPGATAPAVTATCNGPVVNPALLLEKQCRTKFVGSGLSKRVVVYYDITVTNVGNVRLLSVSVRDDKGTAATTDDVVYDSFALAPSEIKRFSGEYNAPNPTAASQSDTVTAVAANEVIGFPGATAGPVTATCAGVAATPQLKLTKKCTVIREPDGIYERVKVITTGTVQNTGDIELINVVVKDDDGTQWRFDYLGVGETQPFSKNEYPNPATDVSYTDTVTATGTAILGFGTATAEPVSATCKGIVTNPQLVLEKECDTVVEENALKFGKVKVLYSGRVRNTGDVTLVNVYITDDLGTATTTDDVRYGPFTLLSGAYAPFQGSYYPSNPTADVHQDTVKASGESILRGFPGATASPVTARCEGIKTNPALTLYKECAATIEEDGPSHKKLYVTYKGYVKNTGDVTLVNVIVTDDLGTPSQPGDDQTYGPFTILPGEEKPFGGKYLPTIATSETFSDTVRATGTNSIFGFPAPAAAQTTATCKGIKTNPELKLEKSCDSQLVYLQDGHRVVQVNYHGTVRNTGDVRLVNVFVTDDKGTPSYTGDDVTYGPFDLYPGQSADFSGSYIPSNPSSKFFNDTVYAYGMSELKGFPGASATPVTATCAGVVVNPFLAVSQKCVGALEDYSGRKRLVITVSGSVTNAGDIELENVVVTLESGAIINVGPLAIGQVYSFSRTIYPTNPTLDSYSFSFVAAGTAILGLGTVTSAPAIAQCEGFPVSPRLRLLKECRVALEEKMSRSKVIVYYSGTVTNTGDIDLINVYVNDDKGTPGVPGDDARYGPFTLAPGASANFSGQYYPSNPTAISFSDTVTASGDNIIIGYNGTTATPVTATCKGIKLIASLKLDKECETALKPDIKGYKKVVYVKFSGTVTNNGEVTLINVFVYDDFKNTPTDLSDDTKFGPFTLKPGESATFYGEYVPADPTSPYFMDTVTATASNSIEGFPDVIAVPVTAKCKGFIFNPKLVLTKQCEVTIEQLDVKDLDCVSVVKVLYRGTVTNNGDIGLIDVIVRDDKGTTSVADDEYFGPFNLQPAESKSFNGWYYPCVQGIPRDIQLSDTVYAKGNNEVIGFAGAEAKPVTATCSICY